MLARRYLKKVRLIFLITGSVMTVTLLYSLLFERIEYRDNYYVPSVETKLNNDNSHNSDQNNDNNNEYKGSPDKRSGDEKDGLESEIVSKPKYDMQAPLLRIEFDWNRRHRSSKSNDSDCEDLTVQFAVRGSLPPCGLVSYPGSGNTWLRRLIEEATGIFTGSIYSDGKLYSAGFYGELESADSGATIVQKAHLHGNQSGLRSRPNLLLLRNPFKALLSHHNFLFAGHQMHAPMSNYRRKDWPSFVRRELRTWLRTLSSSISGTENLLVVHYENLRENPVEELRKILNFLRIPVSDTRLICLQRTRFLQTWLKRPQEQFTESLVIFPNATRDKVDRAIVYSSYLLNKYGHERPPLHWYDFFNDTSAESISVVHCEPNESVVECDQRVDELNYRKRHAT